MTPRRRLRRLLVAAAGVAGVAVVAAACSDSAPSTLKPRGTEARHLASLWWLLFWMATAVYVIVVGFILVAAWRGRRRERADGTPGRRWDGPFIWFGGLVLPAAILGVVAFATIRSTVELRHAEPDELRVVVTGVQWWWDVEYPDAKVKSPNLLRLPAGRPIAIEVHTRDVIHSVWVPQLFGKLDTIPEQTNVLHTRLDTPGTYRGECVEFCGVEHARMDFTVDVMPPADFDAWLASQSAPTPGDLAADAARGEALFESSSCAGCHAVRGTPATGDFGPDLSDLASRPTLGALTIPNDPEHLAQWIANPGQFKPGVKMPPSPWLTPDQLHDLVAYLETLR